MMLEQRYVFQNLRISETFLLPRFVSHNSIETAANFSITLILYYVSTSGATRGG